MTDNNATEHVCAKCGNQLNPINWWTASVTDRYGGQTFKLCKPCAMSVSSAMQAAVVGSGTCENLSEGSGYFTCTNCLCIVYEDGLSNCDSVYFCPCCGKAVKR